MSDQEPTNETERPDDLEEKEGIADEESEPETHDGQQEGPAEESEDTGRGEQEGNAATTPVAATAVTAQSQQAVTWKEDASDFDESTVEIGITLHPLKGRPPEERLVTFCIHNHSGPPVTNYYTQGELTNESPLDRLLWATAQEIRKFRTELSRRKQEQYERDEQAKRGRRDRKATTPPPVRLETPPVASTLAATQAPAAALETAPAAQEERAIPAATIAPTTPVSPKTAKQGSGLMQQPLFS